ncbi:nucleotidyltransferase domain-containing protein [Neobacillus sp. Marseille-QA0830]
MREVIINELRRLEEQKEVKICYAVESGSRAWGYPSRNSDYDVRFIYVHKPAWYLSIEEQREVIERPTSESLDMSGWELRKALRLFNKSNPSLMEWLNTDIVYYQASSLAAKMKDMQPKLFFPQASLFHYLNMAKGNYRKGLQGEEANIKLYLNIIRPILAGKWIATHHSAPPVCFQKLVDDLMENGRIKLQIQLLLQEKMKGHKMVQREHVNALDEFFPIAIGQLQQSNDSLMKPRKDHDYTPELNQLFRQALQEMWP